MHHAKKRKKKKWYIIFMECKHYSPYDNHTAFQKIKTSEIALLWTKRQYDHQLKFHLSSSLGTSFRLKLTTVKTNN